MTVNGLNRTFKFRKGSETIVLADPMPGEMPDAVMNYYANMYPELTTATVHGPVIENDTAEYEIKTTIGTKGKEIWIKRKAKERKSHVRP